MSAGVRARGCIDPAKQAAQRLAEARVEAQVQRKRRRELALAVARSVAALLAYEAANGAVPERLMDEAGAVSAATQQDG